MTRNTIRVLLIDDHPTVLVGLECVLNAASDIVVVGAERDGEQGIESFLRLAPDVVVLDLSMPGEDGLQVMLRIHAHAPNATVLVLTSSSDDDTVVTVIQSGAAGYVLKDSDPFEVVSAVRAAARGDIPIDARVTKSLLRNDGVLPHDALDLTPRERDVLHLVRLGLANKQIASRLGISETTVKSHLGSAFQRIGVNDRTSAALWAQRHLPHATMRST
jgi:DNA-binding NarL/FixJ family response regulator